MPHVGLLLAGNETMPDACHVCDRSQCPTLTMPWLGLGGWDALPWRAGQTHATATVPAVPPAWWSDNFGTGTAAENRQVAREDCAAHAVNWRAEAVRLRANLVRLVALAERWATADWPLTGCESGEDVPTMNACGGELLAMLEEGE